MKRSFGVVFRAFKGLSLCTVALFALFALVACQNGSTRSSSTAPVVTEIAVEPVASPSPAALLQLNSFKMKAGAMAANGGTVTEPAVVAHVTFSKSSLFNRDFLYGADLQYSTIGDGGMGLVLQSLATQHLPVRFRLVDDRLQMVSTTHHLVESDVNAPELLIHEFAVLAQDADTVTVSFREGSPHLSAMLTGPSAPPARSSWVRSVKYDPAGDYILFETSIEQADGTVAEFMESFFPRAALVPEKSVPLFDDPEIEPLAGRFRFIGGEDVWVPAPGDKTNNKPKNKPGARVKTRIASRFDWAPGATPGKTIDWYVTPNAPTDFLPILRDGVEGWNRYSRAMWGVDMVSFKGRLPDGVKIGDPRYNVINWDSVSEAGAAYESRAGDPLTGLQSHALIYLPLAWANIGRTFWETGELADADAEKLQLLKNVAGRGSVLGKSLAVQCLQGSMPTLALEGRLTPDQFSRALMKVVLFHEMGHALGLAHNFKGSLSLNPDDPKTPFSSSIMDYSQYQLMRTAFDGLDSSKGPLLEYDRQILSALYGGGRDIKPSDPVLPACSDAESDDRSNGADPLCIRYDAGHDPTEELAGAIALTRETTATLRGERSLNAALKDLLTELPDSTTITDDAKATDAVKKFTIASLGLVNFYYSSGAQSVNYLMRANVRSLYTFNAPLPAGYDEAGMRQRAIQGLQFVSDLGQLDGSVVKSFMGIQTALIDWIIATPFARSIPEADRPGKLTPVLKTFTVLPLLIVKTTFAATRTGLWKTLARQPTAPFFLAAAAGPFSDFEDVAVEALEKAISSPASGMPRVSIERTTAATSLKTFSDTSAGAAALARAVSRVTEEIAHSTTATARESARSVLKVLNGPIVRGPGAP